MHEDKATEATTYPEHEKLSAVRDKSQTIGEFLDWLLNETEFYLARYKDDSPCMEQARRSIEELIADYLDIDLKRLEAEKRAMLDEIRCAGRHVRSEA